MLFEANLPYDLWEKAIATATYTINKSPCATIDLKTPEELWSGKKPNLSNLRVFGCVAYVITNNGS